MQRFFKNKNRSLYFTEDSYTDNELNIRICNISHCDWTMIRKKALKDFGKKLSNRQEKIETNESDYESNPYFAAALIENGYIFTLRGLVNMEVLLNFKQVDKVIYYLSNI